MVFTQIFYCLTAVWACVIEQFLPYLHVRAIRYCTAAYFYVDTKGINILSLLVDFSMYCYDIFNDRLREGIGKTPVSRYFNRD